MGKGPEHGSSAERPEHDIHDADPRMAEIPRGAKPEGTEHELRLGANSAHHSSNGTSSNGSSRNGKKRTSSNGEDGRLKLVSEDIDNLAAQSLESPGSKTQTQLMKLARFEHLVLIPSAADLSEMDSKAFLGICGSYASNPSKVRAFSDVDTLVISEALAKPENYLEYLRTLNTRAKDFEASTGVKVVFFTRQMMEAAMIFVAGQDPRNNNKELVPCHFLYYRDNAELFKREPAPLASKLLSQSKQLTGDGSSKNPVGHNIASELSALEGTLWDVERHLAELVLNQGLLAPEYIVRTYCDALHASMRMFADHLPLPEVSASDALALLDPDGELKLNAKYQLIDSIRQGETSLGASVIDDLSELGSAILKGIHNRLGS